MLVPAKLMKKSHSFNDNEEIKSECQKIKPIVFPNAIKEPINDENSVAENSTRKLDENKKDSTIKKDEETKPEFLPIRIQPPRIQNTDLPKIIVSQYDSNSDSPTNPEKISPVANLFEKSVPIPKKRKSLFENFNERHVEKKKEIELKKLQEKQREQEENEKYPDKNGLTKKKYGKSLFYTDAQNNINNLCLENSGPDIFAEKIS